MLEALILALFFATSSFAATCQNFQALSPPPIDVCLSQRPIYATYSCLKVRPEGLPERLYNQLLSSIRKPLDVLKADVSVCLGDCYCKGDSAVLHVRVEKNKGGLYGGELVFTDGISGKKLVGFKLTPVRSLAALLDEVRQAIACSAISSVSRSYDDAVEKYSSVLRVP